MPLGPRYCTTSVASFGVNSENDLMGSPSPGCEYQYVINQLSVSFLLTGYVQVDHGLARLGQLLQLNVDIHVVMIWAGHVYNRLGKTDETCCFRKYVSE